jgi:hypothetical protein
MTYTFTTSEPPARVMYISDEDIDPAKLIAFAQAIEPEYRGTIADDNKGGWNGQSASWTIELTVANQVYAVAVTHLMLAGYTVTIKPLTSLPSIPSDDITYQILMKHSMSQLNDLLVEIEDNVISAKWFDSSLIAELLHKSQHIDRTQPLLFCMQGHVFLLDSEGKLTPKDSHAPK